MSTLAALTPIISWLCLNVATGILLTVPLQYRLYFLPATLVPAAIAFRTIQHLNFLPGLSELWGSITLIGLIHFLSLLHIKRWKLRTTRLAKDCSETSHHWFTGSSWKHIYKVASNPRFVRIPYKSVIVPEQYPDTNVKSTAIYRRFSITRVAWLLVKIVIHVLNNVFTTTRFLNPIGIDDFTSAKAQLLRRLLSSYFLDSTSSVSTREMMMRVWFTVNAIWTPILLLDIIHTILAIFFVYIIRVDIPEDWPDLFGSPLEASTLGRFWSRFWHRIHLSSYSDFANLLLGMLPCYITRNTTVMKILMTFLLFLISGLVHQLTSLQLNPSCGNDYADIKFFCMNALAVVLESAFLQLLRTSSQLLGDIKRDEAEKGVKRALRRLWTIMGRLLGYVRVAGFFVWVLPKCYYPRVHCMIEQ